MTIASRTNRREATYTGALRSDAPWLRAGTRFWAQRVLDPARQVDGERKIWTVFHGDLDNVETTEVARDDLDFGARLNHGEEGKARL